MPMQTTNINRLQQCTLISIQYCISNTVTFKNLHLLHMITVLLCQVDNPICISVFQFEFCKSTFKAIPTRYDNLVMINSDLCPYQRKMHRSTWTYMQDDQLTSLNDFQRNGKVLSLTVSKVRRQTLQTMLYAFQRDKC